MKKIIVILGMVSILLLIGCSEPVKEISYGDFKCEYQYSSQLDTCSHLIKEFLPFVAVKDLDLVELRNLLKEVREGVGKK